MVQGCRKGGEGGSDCFIVDAAAATPQGGKGGSGGKLYFRGTILPTTAAAPPSPPPHRKIRGVGRRKVYFPLEGGGGTCALRAPGWRNKWPGRKKTKFPGFIFYQW